MLAKLNRINSWHAAIIIAIIGFAVYFTGLATPFQGDDIVQIVNSVPVHSISNIKLFFESGTFYNGHGLAPLSGAYYRPLMITVFSALYSIFSASPFYFHFFQLLLCIGSSILLYLFFRYSFKAALSLFLALIFLVHPLDSQVVYAIPSMQDALFFFFGILALYLLIRFKSVRSLIVVAVCLFLSLLSKETGIVFIGMTILYLFWWNRARLYPFIGIITIPVVLWLALKTNAVGLIGANPDNAPIDFFSLGGRLLTAPSVVLFYIIKFIFPWQLASAYYWTYPKLNFLHVLLPLIIDLGILALIVYLAFLIRKRSSSAQFYTFIFFGIWAALGIILHLQIIPLDFTASDPWFYFSMAGVLGMIGVVMSSFLTKIPMNINPQLIIAIPFILILILGIRTSLRGEDWRSSYVLASNDITVSKEDYNADNEIAKVLISQNKFEAAQPYLINSIHIFPSTYGYIDYGLVLTNQGDYAGALTAYNNALKQHGLISLAYEDKGQLTLVYGDPFTNKQFLLTAIQKFPTDPVMWTNLALWEGLHNDYADAKVAIQKAANLGQINQAYYNVLMNNKPYSINLENSGAKI